MKSTPAAALAATTIGLLAGTYLASVWSVSWYDFVGFLALTSTAIAASVFAGLAILWHLVTSKHKEFGEVRPIQRDWYNMRLKKVYVLRSLNLTLFLGGLESFCFVFLHWPEGFVTIVGRTCVILAGWAVVGWGVANICYYLKLKVFFRG